MEKRMNKEGAGRRAACDEGPFSLDRAATPFDGKRVPSPLEGMAKDERGIILFTILMLMFIGSLLGVIALNSSNVEIQISGYEKKVSTIFAATEAGIDVGIPVIEETWGASALRPTAMTINGKAVTIDTTNLGKEILLSTNTYDTDTPDASADLSIPDIAGVQVTIDIDRLYTEVMAGGALEFAQGYEGEGKGAAGGGMSIFYKIHSRGLK